MYGVHNLFLSAIFLFVSVFTLKAQVASEEVEGRNSVALRGFVFPTKKPAYYVHPTFRYRFNVISLECGLTYLSSIILADQTRYMGTSIGYVVKPFKRTGRWEPYFDNRLLILARYERTRSPQWQGGGIIEIGTGLDYRIKRFRVGVGFGMGVGYFYSKHVTFTTSSLSLWMFPGLSVSYSFK